MNTAKADGAISLKESMLEVEGWNTELYQRNFNDFLDSQPFVLRSLLDAQGCPCFKVVFSEDGVACYHVK